MKRGAIELPAVMVFIIVAGSFILLFFVVLVMNQGESANKGIQASSLQRLDTLLKGAGTSRETESNITISEEALFYSCDELTGVRLHYESGVDMGVHNQLIFSPESLGGGQLRTYSKAGRAGYHVGTVLYLSTAANVLQNSTYLHDFPSNFPLRWLDNPANADERWRVVMAAPYPGGPSPLHSHPDVVVINDDPAGTFGMVQYYSRGELRGTAAYPNHELLYGAVISKDADTYNCMLSKYLQQLHWVNGIERERLVALKNANLQNACYALYQEFPYEDIANLPVQGSQFGLSHARTLHEAASQIDYMNDALIRGGGGQSCAWLH